MRLLLFALTSLSLTFQAAAQEGGTVAGTVKGAGGKLSDGATVALLRLPDSNVLKRQATGPDGSYTFKQVAYGTYRVVATAVGHNKVSSAPFELTADKASLQLPSLQLEPAAKSMAGVTVTAQRPPIEHKVDRTVVNVDASPTNVGATALEVLEKAPGVMVDKDGNISLKGKEGVLVLVDGRPTQLSGQDLANLLRNMPAAGLDQVEIMTNPPARYDAEGNAGVINIKTKKKNAAGYNGTLSLGYTQGRYAKFNEGLNLAYRAGKVALFTNFNHYANNGFERLSIQRNLRDEDTQLLENYFDQVSRKRMKGSSFQGRIGADYFASKKTTLGVTLSNNHSPYEATNRSETEISTSAKELESITRALVQNRTTWNSIGTNLNFRRVLGAGGRELTADLDYNTYNSRNRQYMTNAYFDPQGQALQKTDTLVGALPQDIRIYSGRTDYTHPLKKGAKLEGGLKATIVRTDNNVQYDSIQYGVSVRDRGRSNHFRYEEAIQAAYVNFNTPLTKKISTQLGLRLENTVSKGLQLTTNEPFDRSYIQLFPTAYFQYKANDKHNFGVNYGRRLRRPNYESLNPFIRFMDRYTYSQGNPELKPQFSNNIELTHSFRNLLTTTLNYTATNDIFQGVIQQKGQETYMRMENIAKQRQYGLSLSANVPLTKWWTSNMYVNVFSNRFEGLVNKTPVAFTATTLALNGSQQFKLTKTTTAEVSGWYRTPGLMGVMRMESMGMMSAGFSQQVLKTKGTLRLTVRDIFYTQKASVTSRYGNVDAAFQEVRDSRVASLGFTYRFSKGKVAGPRKRAGNEEQERVGMD
ncbi:MAG TPA: TonB-dependent receptor [Chitinophagaceae bacterium]